MKLFILFSLIISSFSSFAYRSPFDTGLKAEVVCNVFQGKTKVQSITVTPGKKETYKAQSGVAMEFGFLRAPGIENMRFFMGITSSVPETLIMGTFLNGHMEIATEIGNMVFSCNGTTDRSVKTR